VQSLADKNVYRVFSGGNHTWVLIDEFLPIRNRVRAPSPLFELEERLSPKAKPFLKNSLKADKENIHQANEKELKKKVLLQKKQKQLIQEATTQFISKVIETHSQRLLKGDYFYQVTFCQTKYCHRYINFEIQRSRITEFQQMMSRYIDSIRKMEGDSLLLHKLQEV
jgi:hypothetical protein